MDVIQYQFLLYRAKEGSRNCLSSYRKLGTSIRIRVGSTSIVILFVLVVLVIFLVDASNISILEASRSKSTMKN